ncbi:hypothetical protein PsYK624_063570 [Phanerochaete sordida]|uniref:Uncharacterized protein n=1 Tax=Phanerochaete sordida TaxID=48140 RepID=A0A9P3GA95_9APHY|nr:hypothetical protein PsYK624_063570 [Phanerochaete sordida]
MSTPHLAPRTYAEWLELWGELDLDAAADMLERTAPYLIGFEHPLSPARRALAELTRTLRAWVHGVPYVRARVAPDDTACWTWTEQWWEFPMPDTRAAAALERYIQGPAPDPWRVSRGYIKTQEMLRFVPHAESAIIYCGHARRGGAPRDEVDAVNAVLHILSVREFRASCGALDDSELALLTLLKHRLLWSFQGAGGFSTPERDVSAYWFHRMMPPEIRRKREEEERAKRQRHRDEEWKPPPTWYYTLSVDMYR